jgi:hypothetical protein
MAKFKPGDKVIISKDSKNIWIQGKKATIIRFLEEDNVPGSFYQWTYEVKLEDGYKCYVPQWEMMLEEGTKHHCIFEINKETKKHKFVDDYGEDYTAADDMCKSMNNFRTPDMPVYYCVRCLEQEEFDDIENYSPFISAITVQSVI